MGIASDEVAARVIADLTDGFSSSRWPVEPSPAEFYLLGWSARSCELATGLVALHERRIDARPLLRGLLEHAAALRWLVDHGEDGISALTYDHRRWQRNLRQSLHEQEWNLLGDEDPEQIELPAKPAVADELRHFDQLLARIDRKWYPAYRVVARVSHPSYTSAERHWSVDAEGHANLHIQAGESRVPLAAAAFFLGQILVDAMDACSGGHPALDGALRRAESDLGVAFERVPPVAED